MGFARDFATNCRAQIPLRPQRKFFNCRPKKDLIQRLKREAAKLKGELISISNFSDPYPNLEAKTGLTRKCLETIAVKGPEEKIKILVEKLRARCGVEEVRLNIFSI
jgi:DNA repair photolyase